MPIEIVQQPTGALHGYSVVPISFTVDSRYRVDAVDGGLGGWRLTEERVEPPYVKDYDDTDDERPTRWLRRWDISHWGSSPPSMMECGSEAPSSPGIRRGRICWRDGTTWRSSGT